MAFFGSVAAALDWLGRRGPVAVAAAIALGIAVPPLGALARPYFSEIVLALLVLTFLRVEPEAVRRQIQKPVWTAVGAIWIMAIVPALGAAALVMLDLQHALPALFLALMFHLVAPPVFSSPALAALIGLNAALTLAVLLACTAMAPFSVPALIAAFVQNGVAVSPMSLGIRLALMVGGAACIALAVRGVMGRAWVMRQSSRFDGLSVIVLFAFAAALMGDVLAATFARPALVLSLLVMAFAVTAILAGVTGLAFSGAGRGAALVMAHASASRNMGLMLGAAAGLVPEMVWLYVALAQIPIYLLPMLLKPLARRLSTAD